MRPRFLVLSALALTAIHVNGLAAVGRTPGTFDVSASGEATYTIPIAVPAGVNGLTPQIALTYASRSRQSIAGYGWNISGAMAITRCASTMAQDGVARGVYNDLQDRFCLNGSKLRLVSAAGTYGLAGSEYRTEIETFSRITAMGPAAGNGPGWFKVEGKDGLVYEFGATADSRIESKGQPTARSWALNRVKDRDSNEINYTYDEDTLGAYRLESVTYGGNSQKPTPAIYSITFVYEARPAAEVESSYSGGSNVKETNRLDRIEVKYGSTLYRRYDLTYEAALSVANHSRLASVSECAGTAPDCLSATTFLYEDSPGLGAEANTGSVVPGTNPLPIDVNGDGREDLVYPGATNFWMVLFANSAGGYDPAFNTGVPSTGASGAIAFDYDANGQDDLLVPYSGGTWWVLYGSSSGLSAPQNTGAAAPASGANARALDVDGDGQDDLVWAEVNPTQYGGGDVIRWRRKIPGGAFATTVANLTTPLPVDQAIPNGVFSGWAQSMPRRVPDFNGDGRDDLAFRINIRRDITSLTAKASSQTDAATAATYRYSFRLIVVCPGVTDCLTSAAGVASTPYFGDFNGDGQSDLLYYDDDGAWKYRYATGTTFTSPGSMGTLSTYGDAKIVDWDLDGYDDLLMLHIASSTWHVIRSTGEGFAAPVSTGVSSTGANTFVVADLNGDGVRELAYRGGSNTWRYRARPVNLKLQDQLVTATDALGVSVTFSYAPTTVSTVATRGSGIFLYPSQPIREPLWVVRSLSATDGTGNGSPYTLTYTYEGGLVSLNRRAFLGFTKRTMVDSRLGYNIKTIETYGQGFPYVGALLSAERQQSNGTRMSLLTNAWANLSWGTAGSTQRMFPYVRVRSLDEHELDGTKFRIVTTTVATTGGIDSTSGLILDASTKTTDTATTESKTERIQHTSVFNDIPNWCIGRPAETAVTNSHTLPNGAAITRSFDAAWYGPKCRPTQRRVEPDNATWRVTTNLLYDDFGNASSEEVIGGGSPAMTARTTLIDWGTDGHFPRSIKNALNQETKLIWNDLAARPSKVTDPNGIAADYTYDSFARLATASRADGTKTTFVYGNTCASCASKYRYHVRMDETVGATLIRRHYNYFTQWDQVFLEQDRLLGTDYANTANRDFDARGRLIKQFVPYVGTDEGSRRWTYDRLDRVVTDGLYTAAGALERQSTYSYDGLSSTVTDPLNHATTQTLSAWGDLLSVTDAAAGVLSHEYNAFGELKQTKDALNNIVATVSYVDVRGLRTEFNDMNLGKTTFVPNALGEVVSRKDAIGQTSGLSTTFEYDLLGRMKKRTEPDGTISNWTWGTDAALDEIGRLRSMSGPGYLEELEYDNVGRTKTRKITVDGTTHQFFFTYNSIGELDTLTYPVSTGTNPFKLKYVYSNGYLSTIREFTGDVDNTTFWALNDLNARGQAVDEVYNNSTLWMQSHFKPLTGEIDTRQFGTPASPTSVQDLSYTWDNAGNFKTRSDLRQGISETANYDALNRLTQTIGPAGTLTVAYDAIGNVTSRSDVNSGSSWTYHATKKNAVTVAGSFSYGYDPNGNITSRNGVTQTWNSANLPATLTNGTLSTQFSYAPNRSRWKQVASYSGGTETTLFIGGLLEKHTTSAPSLTNWKHLIATPSGEIQHVRRSNSTTETFYIPSDHLGGGDAVLNAAGAVVVRTSFNAWGARRDDDWVGAPSSAELQQIADSTRHGYTGHDMLDNVGLIHMNGRVYDPAIGRFMSADPFVVPMLGTQGFNRYAYVGNRPLTYTDPTGFEPKDSDCDKGPDNCDPGDDRHDDCHGGCGTIEIDHGYGDVRIGRREIARASQTPDGDNVSTVPVQSWTDAVYVAGPIPVARYDLSIASLTVNGGLNVINSVGNLALNSAGAILQPFDEYAGELITLETSFPGGMVGVPLTGLLGRVSVSIRMATAANRAAFAVRGPAATLELAQEIATHSKQTISIMETAEGPTLVAGGVRDLSATQRALSVERGLTPVELPGFHAEKTLIHAAGERGLTPTRGVSTNNICGGSEGCRTFLEELGAIVDGRFFSF